jgi:hypothetical protein
MRKERGQSIAIFQYKSSPMTRWKELDLLLEPIYPIIPLIPLLFSLYFV